MRNFLLTTSALARVAALTGFAIGGMAFVGAKPALAEFEIQEPSVEKGEVETEYRGAVHFGIKKGEDDDNGAAENGDDDDDGGVIGALDDDEEAPLRQSHDFEIEYGITERFKLSATLGTDEPITDAYGVSSVEIEAQYELMEREDGEDGWALAFAAGYGFATRSDEADEIEFGPIIEYATGPLILTINTYLSGQVGDNVEADGLGFQYGWRAEYEVAEHWGVGVEMFGEVEDLAHSGPWNEQEHSIGPTVFWKPGDDDGDEGELELDDDVVAGPPEMELSFNVGVQFGLTDNTSDSALKFQGSLEF
ncbi:MAG: transporter [Hyphomicrobiaceae bacterium]|nr:transporter [Hyphomicrobiaceae bacterium]